MSVRVQRGRHIVATCSTKLCTFLYAFGEVGLLLGLVQRSSFIDATCPAKSV